MRILITGITGFVGSFLAEYGIKQKGHTIYGICRWRSPRNNLAAVIDKVRLMDADLNDMAGLLRVIQTVKPEVVFHLAAQSYVLTSFQSPIHTLMTNVIGTANLLEAVRLSGSTPVIHVCSSSEVYGQVSAEEVPIKETCPLRPASAYAVSKVGEDMLAYQYWVSFGLRTIRTRMFTHTGPRRGDVFALSAFAKQIAAAEQGLQPAVIRVGNLASVRTFCDVRDAVRAYWLLVKKCPPGEVYNIGGTRTLTIGEALEMLLSYSRKRLRVKVDPKLLRPSDVTLQIPCMDKFTQATGWQPQIPLEQTCKDILSYWRKELRQSPWKAVSVVK